MRLIRHAAILALSLAAAFPAMAAAHAQLLSSTPAAGATLTSLPPGFVLVYDDNLRSDSSFQVLGPGGQTVATGSVDPGSVKTLVAPMPSLANGTYDVRWTAISSDDGFIERGSFTFVVALATPGSSVAASAEPSSAPSGSASSPTPSASTTGDDGAGVDVLIPIAVAGILVGIGLGWFLRRRRAA